MFNNNCTKFILALLLSLLITIIIIFCFNHIYTYNFIIIFVVWFILFSSIHNCVLSFLKCPSTLVPVFSLAIIIIVLYLSGIFLGSLNQGFYLIILIGAYSFSNILISKKTHFIDSYLNQPICFWYYYFFAFVLLLQSVYFGNGSENDSLHHWSLVVNGMGTYHRLIDFPIRAQFKNYTVGLALWGYFINRIGFTNFNFALTNWSNVLLSAVCFIPSLSLFKFGDDNIPYYILPAFLFAYILSIFGFTFCFICLLFLLIIIIPKKSNILFSTMVLSIWFLFYIFMLLLPQTPTAYRDMSPDHILFTLSLLIFIAYLSRPKLSTFLFLSPVLTLGYLFKRPGLFFVAISFLCVFFHFILFKWSAIFYFYKSTRWIIIRKIIITIFIIIVSLIVPPIVWNAFCHSHGLKGQFEINPIPKDISLISKCFFDKYTPQFALTRNNFLAKIKKESIININLKNNGPLFIVNPFLKFINKKILL